MKTTLRSIKPNAATTDAADEFGPAVATDNETEPRLTIGEKVVITAPRTAIREFKLIGVTPYVSNNFSAEAQKQMADKQKKGSQTQKDRKKAPKDFSRLYRGSMHVSTEGWIGHPASTFRQAMVDACRTVGFKMTLAKMGLFILADGYDATDGRPLVKIEGDPREFQSFVRLADGSADISCRARWEKWSIKLRVEFDLDMFSDEDVANLLMRVGRQVGIGAGRPFSKTSCGQDWGRFDLADKP
jgi:hypothetical protein